MRRSTNSASRPQAIIEAGLLFAGPQTVLVTVVNVRIVRMAVYDPLVGVVVSVRLGLVDARFVLVPVM